MRSLLHESGLKPDHLSPFTQLCSTPTSLQCDRCSQGREGRQLPRSAPLGHLGCLDADDLRGAAPFHLQRPVRSPSLLSPTPSSYDQQPCCHPGNAVIKSGLLAGALAASGRRQGVRQPRFVTARRNYRPPCRFTIILLMLSTSTQIKSISSLIPTEPTLVFGGDDDPFHRSPPYLELGEPVVCVSPRLNTF